MENTNAKGLTEERVREIVREEIDEAFRRRTVPLKQVPLRDAIPEELGSSCRNPTGA